MDNHTDIHIHTTHRVCINRHHVGVRMKTIHIFMAMLAIIVLCTTSVFADLNDNLLSYYNMSGSSGSATGENDYFGRANLSKVGGGTLGSFTGLFNNVRGTTGTSNMYYSGAYLRNTAEMTINNNLSFTMTGWVRPVIEVGGATDLWVAGLQVGTDNDFNVRFDNINGKLQGCTQDFGYCITHTGMATSAKFYFYALSYNGTGDKKLTFCAGNVSNQLACQTSTVAVNITMNGMSTLNIGYSPQSAAQLYKGGVDEIGIWNRTLTNTEITALFNSGSGLNVPFPEMTPPTIVSYAPTTSTKYKTIGQVIELKVNTTDNIAVDKVIANITLPDASKVVYNLTSVGGNVYNTSYTLPSTQGSYSVTYIVNDTSNNVATQATSFSLDSIAPSVNISFPLNGTTFTIKPITTPINVTITDANTIVSANCTVVEPVVGTSTVVLSLLSGSIWGSTYTTGSNNGQTNITCVGVDSYTNLGTSGTVSFVIDTLAPSLSDPKPITTTVYNVTSQTLDLSINVTPTTSLSTVYANVTYPNGTMTQYALTNTIGNKFNTSFSLGTQQGRYNVTYLATRTSGISSSPTTTYFVLDSLYPIFYNAGSNVGTFNYSGVISVWTQINNTQGGVTLRFDGADITPTQVGNNYSYSVQKMFGNYSYYWSTHGTGYTQAYGQSPTVVYNLPWVPDITKPNVTITQPVNGYNFTFAGTLTFDATVVDDRVVGSVVGIMTLPNGTNTTVSMTLTSANNYEGYYTPSAIGVYHFRINASDGEGNSDTSETILWTYAPPSVQNGVFQVNTCPTTDTPSVLMFLGVLAFFVAMIFIAVIGKANVLGIVGALGVIFFGAFMFGCYQGFGVLFTGIGIITLAYFVFNKF